MCIKYGSNFFYKSQFYFFITHFPFLELPWYSKTLFSFKYFISLYIVGRDTFNFKHISFIVILGFSFTKSKIIFILFFWVSFWVSFWISFWVSFLFSYLISVIFWVSLFLTILNKKIRCKDLTFLRNCIILLLQYQ